MRTLSQQDLNRATLARQLLFAHDRFPEVMRWGRVEPRFVVLQRIYEFTANDPATWTKPWSVALPMNKTEGPIYEYACHEGNYGMVNILTGARAQEKAAAEEGGKVSK